MSYPLRRSDPMLAIEQAGSVELSLTDFLIETRIYATAIEQALQRLHHVYFLLNKKDFIWPDQCDYATAKLRRIHQSLDEFIIFLDQIPHLPLAIISIRYPLVAKLIYFDEQTQILLAKVNALRLICRMHSGQVLLQKLEILHKMNLIIQGGEDITWYINTLLESDNTINISST